MEPASGTGGGTGSGRGARANDPDRQTHHCRLSDRGKYACGQYHDTGARSGNAVTATAARAGSFARERAIAVTAPGGNARGSARAGRGQEAAGAEAATHGRAGSACTGRAPGIHSICTGCE
jgi:hypothetical protein